MGLRSGLEAKKHAPRSPLHAAQQVLANSLDACPPPLRQLLHCIADTVGAAFAGANGGDLDVANRAVGGLFFLRFVAPALLHPHLHGVHSTVKVAVLARPWLATGSSPGCI